MNRWLLLAHLAGAFVWLGGMSVMLAAVRPAAFAELEPPLRPRLLLAVLARFFPLVWLSIALLLGSGVAALGAAGAAVPPGWLAMAAIGCVMIAVFAVIAFGPMARARRAARDADWAAVGAALQRVHRLVQLNFVLGWLAVAWVVLA